MAGWINGNLYAPTKERLGIVPVPSRLLQEADMEPFQNSGQRMQHRYLAQNQGAKFAIIPICTVEEKRLYAKLRQDLPSMQNNDYVAAAKIWNQKYANGTDCFYKVYNSLPT